MSRKLELLLREWGDWHIKFRDYADEYGANILYGHALLHGRVQDPPESHNILCPDQPIRLRRVDIQLRRLPLAQKMAVFAFYCCPLREDGTQWTKPQLAMETRSSLSAFERSLAKGRRGLKKKLHI